MSACGPSKGQSSHDDLDPNVFGRSNQCRVLGPASRRLRTPKSCPPSPSTFRENRRAFQSGRAGRNIEPPAQQNGNPDEVESMARVLVITGDGGESYEAL